MLQRVNACCVGVVAPVLVAGGSRKSLSHP